MNGERPAQTFWESPYAAEYFGFFSDKSNELNLSKLMTKQVSKYHPLFYTKYAKTQKSFKLFSMKEMVVRQGNKFLKIKNTSIKPFFELKSLTLVYFCYFEDIDQPDGVLFHTNELGQIGGMSEEASLLVNLDGLKGHNLKFLSIFFYSLELIDFFYQVCEPFRVLFDPNEEYQFQQTYEPIISNGVPVYFITANIKVPDFKHFKKFEKVFSDVYHNDKKLNFCEFKSKLENILNHGSLKEGLIFQISQISCTEDKQFFTIEILSRKMLLHKFKNEVSSKSIRSEERKIDKKNQKILLKNIPPEILFHGSTFSNNASHYQVHDSEEDKNESDCSSQKSNQKSVLKEKYMESKFNIEPINFIPRKTIDTLKHFHESNESRTIKNYENEIIGKNDEIIINFLKKSSKTSIEIPNEKKMDLRSNKLSNYLLLLFLILLTLLAFFASIIKFGHKFVFKNSVDLQSTDSSSFFYGSVIETAVQHILMTKIFTFRKFSSSFIQSFSSNIFWIEDQLKAAPVIIEQISNFVAESSLDMVSKNFLNFYSTTQNIFQLSDYLKNTNITEFVNNFGYSDFKTMYSKIEVINQTNYNFFSITRTYVIILVSCFSAILLISIIKLKFIKKIRQRLREKSRSRCKIHQMAE